MTSSKNILLLALLLTFQPKLNGQNIPRQLMQDFPMWVNEKYDHVHPEAKILGLGLFTHTRPLFEQYSEVKMQFAGTDNSKLYIREKGTDNVVLTVEPYEGNYWSMDNALWSPNGNLIAVKQVDDREVPEIQISISDTSEVINRKYSRAGDELPVHSFYIVNTTIGHKVEVRQKSELPYVHLMDWSSDGKKLYFLMSDRLMKKLTLVSVDAKTGKSTTVLTETSDTYVIGLDLLHGYSERLRSSNQVVLFEGLKQFSWLSERSGYKQIYLYNDQGKLIRPLTNMAENGIVVSINEIDKKGGWIYFLAHADKTKPYETQLFRTSLNKNSIEKIADSPGILDVFSRGNLDSLWVLRSFLPSTLQLDCYSSTGEYLETTWEGNSSMISKNRFNFEYVSSLSSDSSEELHSLILKPIDLDTRRSYPVVEYIYGASFENVVPRDLLDNWLWDMNRLAQAGFIVVFTDGRGTPGRGQKFRDFSYGQFGQVELEDHIGALKQIAADRPYVDLTRVGIFGHSWGGHFALRALVEAPDFYTAGHINAGALDPIDFRVAIEPFMGCLPQSCPEAYEKSNVSNKIDQLRAPLMIVHGTMDDDVPIDDAYQLVGLLDGLNYEDYEFIVYEGDNHIVMRNRLWLPQMIEFFTENLK